MNKTFDGMKLPFDEWNKVGNKIQEPLHTLALLNIKTFQDFTNLQPIQMDNLQNPQKLLEKQVNIAFDKAHKTLDYFKQSFDIMENVMNLFSVETKNKTHVK